MEPIGRADRGRMSAMTSVADLRKFMEGAMGKLSPAKAQELAKSVMQGQGKEQVQKTAHDLMEWSNRNRQRITDLVGTEVRSQLSTLGVATKDDLDALKKRVRELERAPDRSKKRTTAKRTTAKRTTAKPKPATTPATTPAAAAADLPSPAGQA
jgi:polyhydroxyalkanoate synthesis regulator phasin